ncbi:MAG: XisH family protein [Prochloraceae cyanobacterium]|nr:XisH family protein [Prochloraceae cyanobacterium]
MPAKDIYHETVRMALIKAGWKITHDPLALKVGQRDLYIDMGAEKQAERTIAVEIKSFLNPSPVKDLENALGQYLLYQTHLKRIAPKRDLYLAITSTTMRGIFTEEIGLVLIEREIVKLIVFDEVKEVIERWIP